MFVDFLMMLRMGVFDGSSVVSARRALFFIKCSVIVCVVEFGLCGLVFFMVNLGVVGKCV